MKYLLLFDIDGTILSLKKGISRGLFVDLFKEFENVDFPIEAIPNFSGKTDLRILTEMCESINYPKDNLFSKLDKIWEYLHIRFAQSVNKDNISLINGIQDFLKIAYLDERFSFGLVTGNFKSNAYLKLSVYELDNYFPGGAFGCDQADRNKLPELAINRINNIKKCEFSSKNSIIIGDTLFDVECAKSNGLSCGTIGEELLNKKDLDSDYHVKDYSNPYALVDKIVNILE